MSEVELEPLPWILKINEKLTFLLLRIKGGMEITEEDYELLKILFRLHWQGVHPLYESKAELTEELSVQQGLFADNKSCDSVVA